MSCIIKNFDFHQLVIVISVIRNFKLNLLTYLVMKT